MSPASFGSRALAFGIDGTLIVIVLRILLWLVGWAAWPLGLVAVLAYFAYFEGSTSGQTIGKRAASIRLVDSTTAQPPGSGVSMLRAGARLVSALPLCLGYLWALRDEHDQTWHDKIAGTVVVPVDANPPRWPGAFPAQRSSTKLS